MKEKKKTEEYDQWEAWSQREYRTGGTQPPKTYGGLVAFLLVLVIFLCGVSTALGLMNIRLFQEMNAMTQKESATVVFSQSQVAATAEAGSPLGFTGQTVPDFWQNYHDLPQGVYITQVISGSDACEQGLHPGDILIACNGIPVTDMETLQTILESAQPGSDLQLRIYRAGEELDFTVLLQ